MIVLKHIETFEDCPNGCESISYLHDDKEYKSCCGCNVVWNRIDNTIIDNKQVKQDINKL